MNTSELIKQMSNTKQAYSLLCKVIAVDEDAFTCDVIPLVGGADFLDVRLKANLDYQKGLVIIPAKHSHVIIHFLTEAEAYIAQYSEIEKVTIKIGNTEIITDKDSTTVKNGNSEIVLNKDSIKMQQTTSKVTVSASGTKIERAGISLSTQLDSLFTQIQAITVTCPTPGGPVVVPINNAAAFIPIQQTIAQIII